MIKLIAKGMAIGIANVIPGVSGGTIAILLGVYDQLLLGFSDLATHPIKAITRIWPLLLGVALGILVSLFSIDYLLEVAPIPTTVFFVGLILGGFGPIHSQLPKKPWHLLESVLIGIPMIVVIALPLLAIGSGENLATNMHPLILLLMGVVGAATMVVPGVSGSMVLLILGYYQPVISLISSFIAALLALNFNALIPMLLPLIGFGVGILIGLIGISKLLTYLLDKQRSLTFLVIYGLLLGSPIAILIQLDFSTSNTWMIGSAVITLLLGIFASGKLSSIKD